jgi:hypothetical protein
MRSRKSFGSHLPIICIPERECLPAPICSCLDERQSDFNRLQDAIGFTVYPFLSYAKVIVSDMEPEKWKILKI